MKKSSIQLLFLLTVSLFITKAYAQEKEEEGIVGKVLNYFISDDTESARAKFIVYPTIAYAPETRWEFGLSGLLVYYADRDTTNRLSEINAFTFITLENQYGLWLDHALYSDKSKWFFLGRIRLQQFPLLYYGEGPNVSGEELARIDGNSINVRERLLRQLRGSLYIGLETEFQRLSSVDFQQISETTFPRPRGLDPFNNFGFGLGLVYDDRHNVLNVRKGFFGETGFLRYDDAWGSDFNFTSYFLDARYFYPVTTNQVFASQFFFAHVDGNPPFNQLALMGGENLMRGYYLGRYRDNTYIAAQSEYRFLPFDFSQRWGAATFLSVGTVADSPAKINLSNLKLAGGAGVRFLIFPNKDIFTRFDVAFSEDGPGYYFFIGEAF